MKSVSFDDEGNEIQIVERALPELKAELWFPKEQFRMNRRLQQEQVMMEQTRSLVQAKLLEQAGLSSRNVDELSSKLLRRLQKQVDEIMNRSKPEILEFLQSQYNWITDCTEYWKDLPVHIQTAASTLGYTESLWNEFSQQLDVFDLPWHKLSVKQQEAAQVLGYNTVTWNGSLEHSVVSPEEDDDVDDKLLDGNLLQPSSSSSSSPASNVVPVDDDDDDEPMYDWGSTPEQISDDESSDNDVGNQNVETYIPSTTATTNEDMDEEEFIANFLLEQDDHRHLGDRYVPSDDDDDDPFDLLEEGHNDDNDKAVTNETSPLLGPSSKVGGSSSGLVRRMWFGGSSSGRQVPFGHANDDDDDDDTKPANTAKPYSKSMLAITTISVAAGLALLYLWSRPRTSR